MVSIFSCGSSFFRRGAIFFFFCAVLGLAGMLSPSAASASRGTLPPEVQKVLSALMELRSSGAELPAKADMDAFLAYTTSPLNLTVAGEEPPRPAKYQGATGIMWRNMVKAPFSTTLQYLYNPKISGSVVYPASIRRSNWQPGSDILALTEPLVEQFAKLQGQPRILRGSEFEEITPDTFSGAYYSYVLDRLLILTEHQGRRVMISLSWQKERSEVGKKAAFIGQYEDWDFIYSGAKGTLAKGIGWADTFIYSSACCTVFYEDAPEGNMTGYAMYRWMNAGWSGMNMVKGHHIVSGAERSFLGLQSFMESPKRPDAEDLVAYRDSLEALDLATLRERFKPYSVKVVESVAAVDALQTEDFQKVIKDAGYGDSLQKEEIIATMCVNYLKGQLGLSQLAGPLGDEEAAQAADAQTSSPAK